MSEGIRPFRCGDPFTISIPGERSGIGPVPHMHGEFVPGCFRCDLSRAEINNEGRESA